jgi:hypothetical protein
MPHCSLQSWSLCPCKGHKLCPCALVNQWYLCKLPNFQIMNTYIECGEFHKSVDVLPNFQIMNVCIEYGEFYNL